MEIRVQQSGGGANRPELAETVPLVLCPACGAEARDRDRFCRRCGIELENQRGASAALGSGDATSGFATSPLTRVAAEPRVSGMLLNSIASAVSTSLANYPVPRAVRKIAIALISIPLWILIVLLSPLDAYVAAKAMAQQS